MFKKSNTEQSRISNKNAVRCICKIPWALHSGIVMLNINLDFFHI